MVEITERDKKIFNILFRLRYMTPKQLSLYLGCPLCCVYKRAEKLIRDGYLESKKIESINKKVYVNGAEIRKEHERFTYRKKVIIKRNITEKRLLVNDIFIHLVSELGVDEDDIVTEREIFWKRTGLRRKIIIPDLVVKKVNKNIAIKVENSMKKIAEYSKRFTNYTFDTDFYCINYLCTTKEIKNTLLKVIKKENRTFIKAYLIDEFFNGERLNLC